MLACIALGLAFLLAEHLTRHTDTLQFHHAVRVANIHGVAAFVGASTLFHWQAAAVTALGTAAIRLGLAWNGRFILPQYVIRALHVLSLAGAAWLLPQL